MKHVLLSLLLCFPLVITAQEYNAQSDKEQLRRFVVADIETRVPVRGAIVATKNGYRDTTNYRGVCFIPVQFDTISVMQAKYLTERLTLKETKDSTYLIPNSHQITEVTVWGDGQPKVTKGLQDAITQAAKESAPVHSGIGFDFANLLDRRGRRDRKHLEKTRGLFNQIDQSKDPIVEAYKKAMEEQKEKEREKEKEENKQQ